MKLEELEIAQAVDGEICSDGFEDADSDLEQDLQDALEFMERMLDIMEEIHVKAGRITKIPKGMTELMEESAEFLDQWDNSGSDDKDDNRVGVDAFQLCSKCNGWKHTGKCKNLTDN